jgi:hypothetical protein
MKKLLEILRKNPQEAFFFLVLLLFSTVIMFKTFGVEDGSLKIASKAWSDFAATIPLIRSFSLGDNFPPEYPIFPGFPIRYHFVFFFLAGALERAGLRIDFALNILSVLSFFMLCVAIYFLAKAVFKKGSIAFISVVLFLFNGSLAFLDFFKNHPLSANTLKDIIANTSFPSFGPYDGRVVSAFWNLNIYTNQRHLGLSYAAFLGLVLVVYKASQNPKKFTFLKALILGISIGLFPFVHSAVFGMMGVAVLVFFFLYPRLRTRMLVTGAVALLVATPQLLYMGPSQVAFPHFDPGYLLGKLTLGGFVNYWILNLGLGATLVPVGFILSNKSQKKIVFPFVVLFVIGNLFRFTPEIAANHKFFNLFVIGINFFSAFSLIYLWQKGRLGKIVAAAAFFFVTLSGVIELFPILNDSYIKLPDYKKNPISLFIVENTAKDAIFLNSSFLYDPASLAGRKIYLGWPYFPWSAGYDTDKRHQSMKNILGATNKNQLCQLLGRENIDYVEIQNPSRLEAVAVNYPLFEKNFVSIFFDQKEEIKIYDVGDSCKK